MAITVVGTPTSNSGINNPVTTFPAGWVAGDVGVIFVGGNGTSSATASGWTVPTNGAVSQGASNGMTVLYRVLQAGDTAPTITFSATKTVWSVIILRGADTTTVVDDCQNTSQASGATLASATTTAATNGDMQLTSFTEAAGNSTGTTSAGTEYADVTTGSGGGPVSMQSNRNLLTASGSIAGTTETFSVTSGAETALSVLILPRIIIPTPRSNIAVQRASVY